VSYKTPKISKEVLNELRELNNFYDEENFGRYADMTEQERGQLSLDPKMVKI
jgi:hypothetical protein